MKLVYASGNTRITIMFQGTFQESRRICMNRNNLPKKIVDIRSVRIIDSAVLL